jgi:hypothetical protein
VRSDSEILVTAAADRNQRLARHLMLIVIGAVHDFNRAEQTVNQHGEIGKGTLQAES